MKTILTACALFLGAVTTHAQSRLAATAAAPAPGPVTTLPAETRSDFTLLVDSLIANLDKSRIPTGILYDRVASAAGLHTFNQNMASSASHLFQSYFDLRQASYVSGPFPMERAGLRKAAEAEATGARLQGGNVPIGVLDYQFATLDTLAEDRGTIRDVNGLYYDGVGSPYLTNRVTIASPLADSVYQTVNLTLPTGFQFKNTGRAVSYAFAQVGWNQYILANGGSANVTFPGTGLQTLSFTIYFTDGSVSNARAQVFVKAPTAQRTNTLVEVRLPNVYSQQWRDYFGVATYGEGEITSHLAHPQSHTDHKLRNPIIVMDGFDPSDRRKLEDIYGDFGPLLPALQQSGRERDLVILNFPKTWRTMERGGRTYGETVDGGADYVERNALVLVQLLHDLKPRLADPNGKITIIGPSMGGLISRYALALMEKNYDDANNPATYRQAYWKHNVDVWLSFDAPHQGANIPLGDQYFIDYFKNVSESAEENLARLNSVAAQQMLVQHALDFGGGRYHIPFMRNLQNNGLPGTLGWPQQVRRVALANGSNSGQMNSSAGTPGGSGIQLDVARTAGNKRRQFFYRSTTPGTQIAANMYFASNAGTMGTVFNGEARVIVALFRDVVKRRQNQSQTPWNSYDLAPGGTYDAQQQIVSKTLNGPQEPGYEYRFTNTRPYHCFIPTVSALAFQYRTITGSYGGVGTLPNAYTNLATRPLICNDETPFDAYYAYPGTNAFHVTLDNAAQLFVVRELFNQSQPASFQTGNATVVCLNGTTTLNLNDCSQRTGTVTYAWTVSGPAVFTSTGTTTVSGPDIAQGIRSTGTAGAITVSVVATRTGAAPSPATTHTLTATAGTPLEANIVWQPGQVKICPYSSVQVQAQGLTNGPYYWSRRTVGTTTWTNSTTTSPNLLVRVNAMSVEVRVTAPGLCSGANLPYAYVNIDPYDNGGSRDCNPYSFRVAPVPSDQYVEVSSLSETEPEAAQQAAFAQAADDDNPLAYQAELFNDRGRVMHLRTTRNGKVRIDTSTLPSGLYHVRLRRGGRTETRNIQITH